MVERSLGNTGMKVSEVAFGGVEIGIPYGMGINSANDMLSEKEAIALLHASLDSGINFYDTARMYGRSENIIGKAFQYQRNDIVISTKCRHFVDEVGTISGDQSVNEIIEASLKESLHALRTDFADIFMLHQSSAELIENDDIASAFLRLKKEGIIRATGISTNTPQETILAIDSGIWDVIQLPFNLLDQRQEVCFSKAKKKGVGLVIRSVLMKGLLTDKGIDLHPALGEVVKHIACYDELLDSTKYNISTLATKFALAFPEISTVLIGMDRREYLDKSLESANGIYLEDKTKQRAQQLSYPDPSFLDLRHWAKMNWLK